MQPLVMKFGGSSVADADCLRDVGALVYDALPHAPLVVLSAMGKTTDALFALARDAEQGMTAAVAERARALVQHHRDQALALLDGNLPPALQTQLASAEAELDLLLRAAAHPHALTPRDTDAIVSLGERLSTALLAAYLQARGVPTTWLDARLVLRTDDQHGAAQPDLPTTTALCAELVRPHLGEGRAAVVQGYVGATAQGVTTTLGRGGSDYSATLFGAALGAREVQVWTDVEGVLTADPRLVPHALPIAELSYAEAAELAAFGAKVLHPSTMQPVVDRDIPVTVRHTKRPRGRFTRIAKGKASGRAVTALAARGPVTVMTVTSTRTQAQPGFLAGLLDVFARARVSVDLVATADVRVSLTVEPDAPAEALSRQIGEFATVTVARDRAIVALVGEHLEQTPGLAARALAALADTGVEMLSIGADEMKLSFAVPAAAMPDAVRRLHRDFLEPRGEDATARAEDSP